MPEVDPGFAVRASHCWRNPRSERWAIDSMIPRPPPGSVPGWLPGTIEQIVELVLLRSRRAPRRGDSMWTAGIAVRKYRVKAVRPSLGGQVGLVVVRSLRPRTGVVDVRAAVRQAEHEIGGHEQASLDWRTIGLRARPGPTPAMAFRR